MPMPECQQAEPAKKVKKEAEQCEQNQASPCQEDVSCKTITSFIPNCTTLTQVDNKKWFKKHNSNALILNQEWGKNLSHGHHRTIDWNKKNMKNLRFVGTKLKSILAEEAYWEGIDFQGTDNAGTLKDVEWEKSTLENAIFAGTCDRMFKIKAIKFDNAHLKNVIFRNVVLDHSKAKLRRPTSFKNAVLENVSFENVDFKDVTFTGATFKPGTKIACPKFDNQLQAQQWFSWRFMGAKVWVKDDQYLTLNQQSLARMAKDHRQGQWIDYSRLQQYAQN